MIVEYFPKLTCSSRMIAMGFSKTFSDLWISVACFLNLNNDSRLIEKNYEQLGGERNPLVEDKGKYRKS